VTRIMTILFEGWVNWHRVNWQTGTLT